MPETPNSPINFAAELERIANELNQARTKSRKSSKLYAHVSGSATKGGYLLLNAINDRVLPYELSGLGIVVALGKKQHRDAHAQGLFKMLGLSLLRKLHPERFKAGKGTPGMSPLSEIEGKRPLVGRDGKPLVWIESGEWGETRYAARLSGEPATGAHDRVEQDRLDYYRTMAIDYADVCRVLALTLRKRATSPFSLPADSCETKKPNHDSPEKEESERIRKQEERNRAYRERGRIYRQVGHARKKCDVPELLRLLCAEIELWINDLKSETLSILDDTECSRDARRMFRHAPKTLLILPGEISKPFLISPDALDLVELAVGESQARSLTRRLDLLNEQKTAFARSVADVASTWDDKGGNDFRILLSLDEQRKALKVAAYDACRFIETLAILAAARIQTLSAATSPIPSTASKAKTDNAPASSPVPSTRNEPRSQRPDGFYPPRTVVWHGQPHECDLTKGQMAFLQLGLHNIEIDVCMLMHQKTGTVWKERYMHSQSQRDKISQYLSRLNKQFLAARPPLDIEFSLRRGADFVSRTEPCPR